MAKLIVLTRGKVAIVDDEDYEDLSKYKWYCFKTRKYSYGSRGVWIDGKSVHILMHRQIMGFPEGMMVDHKDFDGLNNQRSNLRVCTRGQNTTHSKVQINKHGYRGIVKFRDVGHGKPWGAFVRIYGGKRKYLGTFCTAVEAALDF